MNDCLQTIQTGDIYSYLNHFTSYLYRCLWLLQIYVLVQSNFENTNYSAFIILIKKKIQKYKYFIHLNNQNKMRALTNFFAIVYVTIVIHEVVKMIGMSLLNFSYVALHIHHAIATY